MFKAIQLTIKECRKLRMALSKQLSYT